MTLTLLHTTPLHVATFDTLRDRMAPDLPLRHVVRPGWLARARAGGSGPETGLPAQVARLVALAPGPLVCTCSTLGPLAEAAGGARVDRPMMAAAARRGGRCLMACALDSTAGPSRALYLEAGGNAAGLRLLTLTGAWPLFEAGDTAAFQAAIAAGIRSALADSPADVVVLAQVSMAGAADLLADLPVPVLSAPAPALRAALDQIGTTG